jgi:hypothetical protein
VKNQSGQSDAMLEALKIETLKLEALKLKTKLQTAMHEPGDGGHIIVLPFSPAQ